MSEFFRRVEKKYIITKDEYLMIRKCFQDKMIEDEHGKSTICNIYLDTNEFELIKKIFFKMYELTKVRAI